MWICEICSSVYDDFLVYEFIHAFRKHVENFISVLLVREKYRMTNMLMQMLCGDLMAY